MLLKNLLYNFAITNRRPNPLLMKISTLYLFFARCFSNCESKTPSPKNLLDFHLFQQKFDWNGINKFPLANFICNGFNALFIKYLLLRL